MKGNRQKVVKVEKPKDKRYYKKMGIIQLCIGIVLVAAGFITYFGAFTLFGGGFLVLAATNYIQYKGEKKATENPDAEPRDSLNHR